MKRLVSLAIIATALVGSGTAAAQSNPASITLHLRSKLQHASYVDNPPVGRSPGDVLIFTEKLLNASGRVIGSDAAMCTYLFDRRSLCTGAYILPSGELMVQLVLPGPTGVYSQAIIGGTGRYARATGSVIDDQRPSGDHFTFRIRLPAS
ncbi:MAG: hypothetical protein M3022_19595 [Actinomycetota bacterium]|nr:hypothetical protein [Actinomycetota bacterium]